MQLARLANWHTVHCSDVKGGGESAASNDGSDMDSFKPIARSLVTIKLPILSADVLHVLFNLSAIYVLCFRPTCSHDLFVESASACVCVELLLVTGNCLTVSVVKTSVC